MSLTLNMFMRSTLKMSGSQDLFSDNATVNLDEGLMAVVKDPLWFVSRQWQTGEFEAENGGSPASIVLDHVATAPNIAQNAAGEMRKINPVSPWEQQLEENDGDDVDLWVGDRMEYMFDLSNDDINLKCEEHHARRFDWYSFDLEQKRDWTDGEAEQKRYTPATLSFKGMPHPRWWKLESGETFLENGYDPEPNALSTILAEYVVADANNWFLSPLELDVGAMHAITNVQVADNFGVVSDLSDLNDEPNSLCRLFDLSGEGQGMLLPNTGNDAMTGEAEENVLFIRDENANTVWAIEKNYFDETDGITKDRGSVDDLPSENTAVVGADTSLPAYQLRTDIACNWIPYIPVRYQNNDDRDEQVYFRRATMNAKEQNYKTDLVSKTWRIREEEIPRYGVRLQYVNKAVCDANGQTHFWQARRKDFGFRHPKSSLDFDIVA